MGARARLRALGVVQAWVPRERLAARRSAAAVRVRLRSRPARRGVVVVLVRGDRDREVAVREGREPRVRDGVPVRFDEPRLRARDRAVALHRLAVHARRVRRRRRPDHRDVDRAPPARHARARGGDARDRARRPTPGHVHPTAVVGASAAAASSSRMQAWSDVAHNFRGDWQMLWKEIGAGFLIAGYVVAAPDATSSTALFVTTPRAGADRGERRRRADRRRPRVRLLDRERAARRGALGERDLVLRRRRVPLRRPVHPADRRVLPQGLRRPVRRASSSR